MTPRSFIFEKATLCCASEFSKASDKLSVVITPNHLPSLFALEGRPLAFHHHYESFATPFEWKFIRRDLGTLLSKLNQQLSCTAYREAA